MDAFCDVKLAFVLVVQQSGLLMTAQSAFVHLPCLSEDRIESDLAQVLASMRADTAKSFADI